MREIIPYGWRRAVSEAAWATLRAACFAAILIGVLIGLALQESAP